MNVAPDMEIQLSSAKPDVEESFYLWKHIPSPWIYSLISNFSFLNVTFVCKSYDPPKLVQVCSFAVSVTFLLHNKSQQM